MTVGLSGWTASVLRLGTYSGIALMAAGLLLGSFDFGKDVMDVGIIVLIMTPLAGVLVSTACLWREGDIRWLRISLLLIAVIAVGVTASAVL